MSVVSVEKISFGYNGLAALSDVSLQVEAGDYLGIVGPNGSGKSTLIKNILGILRPPQGRIRLFDRDISDFNEWQRIGYLPQRLSTLAASFPGTVKEIVNMGRNRITAAKMTETLERLGIARLAGRMIGELSYGEQQRTLLARALIGNPELMIFDEPTTALDPETREIFYGLTREINQTQGTSIILVTHDIGTIGQYAQNLLYLDHSIIFSGTFGDFCASPEMTGLFGPASQHIICHQHHHPQGAPPCR